ncbi:MAG: hypothetical protein ILP12_06185 [Lachnospiraceae bacterium]|nr:hypothetical protein [Lachnospiraceae bacterium]
MIFTFEASVLAPQGKLSREDRTEIRDYLNSVRIDAPDPEKACRQLARLVAGRLSKESSGGKAVIALPDYGSSCQVRVTAHAED